MTDIFQRIAGTVPRLPGWCSIGKAQNLAAMVIAMRPTITVELGVYGGRSLIPMALAHKLIGHGMVWGIDPWTAESASEGYEGAHREWWSKHANLEGVYKAFTDSLNLFAISPTVRVIRAKSDTAPVPEKIDLLHLDAQHTDHTVKDCERFGVKVRVGGILVFDDVGWNGGGVGKAEQFAQTIGFEKMYHIYNKDKGGVDDYSVFQRVKA